MYKLKEMILMLCLILSGAFCYANDAFEKGIETDGGPISKEIILLISIICLQEFMFIL